MSRYPHLFSHIPLGQLVSKSFFQDIVPNEMVFDNGQHYSILCMYPNGGRVRDFHRILAQIKEKTSMLVPAYYLVDNGSSASYFVLYLRKEKLR